MNYEHLFRPIKIRGFTSKNRIEVSPAEPFLCTKDGLVTDEFVAFTASLARGGAGIVTVGDSPVTQEYADNNRYVVNLADPYIVHGLVKVSDAIHRYGALASIELNLRTHVFPADMSVADIKQVIKDFTDCAVRCKKGGFDMIMLHGGHGHTIAQFYSPLMNKRTDEYGAQNFENRCRFAKELLTSVRDAIGPDMAIDYRISGDELTEGGVGVDDAVMFAKEIQSQLDIIHVSAGNMYAPASMSYTIQPTYLPLATNVRFAERFRQELDIPVTSVGSFNLDLAETAVASGQADVIAMIRQFVADPDCAEKARLGKGDEIRPCIRCCICTGDDPHGCPKPLRCSVNPAAGRNPQFDNIEKAPISRKVVVIGGGCAGMEAARRLAERGHEVVLFEREKKLGGNLIAAGANEIKGDVRRYAEWSVRMTKRTPGIKLRLCTEATRDAVTEEAPYAVIIAVGSSPFVPNIPGVDGSNVLLAADVDLGRVKPGKRVVIIGSGLTGTETAVSLAQNGHDVTQIDMLPLDEIDRRGNGSPSVTAFLRRMAVDAGVNTITGVRAEEISDGGVAVSNADGTRTLLECDSVILSMGVRPRSEIVAELSGISDYTYVIGDCSSQAGNITSAVREGFYAAMNI